MADYLPKAMGDLTNWLANLKLKLPTYSVAFGLTAAQLLAIQNLCDQLTAAIQSADQKQADAIAATLAKTTLFSTALPTLRADIAAWKTNAAMTPTVAAELQVTGTSTPFDPNTFQALITADVFPGYVRFKFKKGQTDGIILNVRLKGTTVWKFCSRDTNSPYDDHTPVAVTGTSEAREYQAQGVLNDQPIGQLSSIVSVTVAG